MSDAEGIGAMLTNQSIDEIRLIRVHTEPTDAVPEPLRQRMQESPDSLRVYQIEDEFGQAVFLPVSEELRENCETVGEFAQLIADALTQMWDRLSGATQ